MSLGSEVMRNYCTLQGNSSLIPSEELGLQITYSAALSQLLPVKYPFAAATPGLIGRIGLSDNRNC